MKKILLSSILSVLSIASFSQVQEVMVIEKSDKSKVTLNVNDISRVTFESLWTNPTGKVAEAVDLGLPSGVKWASWNLGASSASEYGGYYGWADPTGKKSSTDLNDYPSAVPPTEISGTEYDVAKVMWGSEWRMPTYDDIEELYEQCKWYKADDGIEIVGPNGSSITLPYAGSREGTEIYDTQNYGYYWAGTLHKDDSKFAWMMNIDNPKGKYGLAGGDRYYGLSVRPVYGKPVIISITIDEATDITETSAMVKGKVNGVTEPVKVTIPYYTTSGIEVFSFEFVQTDAQGNFTCKLTGMTAGTGYEYYAWYKQSEDNTINSEKKKFTTKETTKYAVGDYYPNEYDPEGVVFTVQSDGQHGKIFSLTHDHGSWKEMKSWVNNLGNGWYMPTERELSIISNNYRKYPSDAINPGFYYSSTVYSSSILDTQYYVVTLGSYINYTNGYTFHVSDSNGESCLAVKQF